MKRSFFSTLFSILLVVIMIVTIIIIDENSIQKINLLEKIGFSSPAYQDEKVDNNSSEVVVPKDTPKEIVKETVTEYVIINNVIKEIEVIKEVVKEPKPEVKEHNYYDNIDGIINEEYQPIVDSTTNVTTAPNVFYQSRYRNQIRSCETCYNTCYYNSTVYYKYGCPINDKDYKLESGTCSKVVLVQYDSIRVPSGRGCYLEDYKYNDKNGYCEKYELRYANKGNIPYCATGYTYKDGVCQKAYNCSPRSCNCVTKWSEWSPWADVIYTESSTREVQVRVIQ